MKNLNWRLWTPLLTGFGVSAICGIAKDTGKELPQRPPAIVFKIIWPILYMLLGYSWKQATSQIQLELLHGICTFLLVSWIVLFSCQNNKKMGIYIIACTIAVVVCCMSLHTDRLSVISLTPLLAWLMVAFQLNWHII